MNRKKQLNHFLLCFLLLSCTLMANGNKTQAQHDINDFTAGMVVSWNEQVMAAAVAEDGLLTLKGVRTLSMLHGAMHDALNAIHPVYTGYAYKGKMMDASPVAAAAQAAFRVAADQYPGEQHQWAEELDQWLNAVEDGPAKTKGITLGEAAAMEILGQRENDHWNAEAEYTWRPMGPGVYAEFNEHSGTPEGFVFGAGWARAKPFLLPAQNHFRSPPPPQINSEAYVQAWNEVKEVGRFGSTGRTSDQTHLAMWWKDFVENSHNRLARELTIAEDLNLWTASRMFALLNMSICDAYISVFDNKFFYNHWRPYTAIRWAENDGNPDTMPNPEWDNLHKHTYAFPSYPSAHGSASAAAMAILEDVFGDDYAFTMTTREVDSAGPFSGKVRMDPPTRSFAGFMEAAMEASLSRVYLGIHFRYDSEEGFRLGSQVGNYALDHFLKPGN